MKHSRQKPTSAPPSLDNPGGALDLPPEVATGGRQQSPREKERELQEAEILNIFKTEIGGKGFITFQRRHPPSGMAQYQHLGGQMAVETFSIDNVTSLYGGGDFIARARTNEGKFAQEVRFMIDHSIPPKNPKGGAAKDPAPAQVDTAAIIKELSAALKPGTQDNSVFLAMLQQNTAILTAALAKPAAKEDSTSTRLLEVLIQRQDKADERFEKLIEKMSERDHRGDPLHQLAQTVKLLDDIRGENPEKEKGSFAEMLGKGIASVAVPMLERFGQPAETVPGLAAPAGPVSPVMANGAGATHKPQPPQPTVNPALRFALNRFRSAAITAAQKAKDPFEFVDSLFDMVPPDYHATIYNQARAKTWFADLFGNDPEASKHVDWLGQMRDAVLTRMLVVFSQACAAQKLDAAATVEKFLEQIDEKFEDTLWNIIDQRNWGQIFGTSGIDAAWLEELRAAFEKELNDDSAPGATAEAAEEKK